MSPLLQFCEWLDTHRLSTALHESLLMYPLTESTHVWGLALFVGFTILLDLRLVGLALTNVPVSVLTRRLMPWTIAGFIIMVVTGFMLFYAIPIRTYHSVWFRVKVVALILAGINVWIFHRGIWLKVQEWDMARKPPRRARIAGGASLFLWALIIFMGRMIAYNWFDCDRQPQPDFINWMANCQLEEEVASAEVPAEVQGRLPDDPVSDGAAEDSAPGDAPEVPP